MCNRQYKKLTRKKCMQPTCDHKVSINFASRPEGGAIKSRSICPRSLARNRHTDLASIQVRQQIGPSLTQVTISRHSPM